MLSTSKLSQGKTDSPSEVRLVEVLDAYLAAAQEGTAPARDALLAEHPELAEDLEACLASLEFIRQASLTAPPVVAGEAMVCTGKVDAGIGDLGDFRLIAEVGRGGMGVVYEAMQLSLNRRVALKVLPFAAAMDPTQLRRFQTEALAAAQLHHTHIVPVYSVGCERGVHYYAMQFIEGQTLAQAIAERRRMDVPPPPAGRGVPITSPMTGEGAPEGRMRASFPSPLVGEGAPQGRMGGSSARHDPGAAGSLDCARRGTTDPAGTADRGSPIAVDAPTLRNAAGSATPTPSSRTREYCRRAAALGIQAAEALEHAHKFGIVHRDIKPANLLLDVQANLWITDFGLARLQDDAGLTITGDLLGTLRYMSPEQALAKRGYLDHRTDIYSLGATLYELVTLRPAIDGQDRQEVLRKIAHDEPTAPRRLNPAIPRELETILLKAMNKEPELRYATAQELADDLERFLEDKPVRAKRPALLERATKWTRRHRTLVGSAAVVLIMAVIGLSIAAALIWRERGKTQRAYQAEADQRRLLATNLELALKVLDEIYVDVAEKRLPRKSQFEQEDRELLRKALAFYELFATQNDSSRHARFEAGSAHGRAGDIRRILGEHQRAQEDYERAISVLEPLTAESPAEPRSRKRLAEVYAGVCSILRKKGNPREAERVGRQALAIRQKLVEEFTQEGAYRFDLAKSYEGLLMSLAQGGSLPEAIESGKHSIEILDGLVKEYPREPKYQRELSDVHNALAVQVWSYGRIQEAAAGYRKALEILVRLVGDDPADAYDRESLAYLYNNLSVVLGPDEMADRDRYGRLAIRLREQLASDFPNVPEHQHMLSVLYDLRANRLNEQGLWEQAEKDWRRALEIRERLVQRYPDVPVYQAAFGAVLNNLAEAFAGRGEFAEARRLFDRAIAQQLAALRTNSANPVWRQYLRNHHSGRTEVLVALGAHKEAAQAAADLARFSLLQWQDQLKAAQMLIRCFLATNVDARLPLPVRGADAGSYADQAETLLRDVGGLIGNKPQALNDLAWLLANCEVLRFRDPPRAVVLATKATELAPKDPAIWSTLGVAHYRVGHWKDAIGAMERSMQFGSDSDPITWFFLAMAHFQKGQKDQARQWYDKAVDSRKKNHSQDDELRRFRAEAAVLLGLTEHPTPTAGKKEENTTRQSKP